MQYLPVAFAVFQVFFLPGLVIYYMAQAILRIGQQHYITRRFYGHDESLGRQAQRASEQARELAKADGDSGGGGGGGGFFAQARRELASPKNASAAPTKAEKAATAAAATAAAATVAASATSSKRTTQPKNRPTPSGKGPAGRPTRTPSTNRPGGPRGSDKKRR